MSAEVWPSNFHHGGKADTGSKHLCGIGVAKLMRDDARGEADRMTDLVKVIAELTDECFFGEREACRRRAADRENERTVAGARVHKQTNPRGPCVPSSGHACLAPVDHVEALPGKFAHRRSSGPYENVDDAPPSLINERGHGAVLHVFDSAAH